MPEPFKRITDAEIAAIIARRRKRQPLIRLTEDERERSGSGCVPFPLKLL